MKKTIIVTVLLAIMQILTAVQIYTEDYKSDAGSIYISAGEDNTPLFEAGLFGEDYLGTGSSLNFSGKADDLYLMGKSIIFTGESTGGLTAFAETVEIEGLVAQNLHSAGKSVRINGRLQETAFLAGEHVIISEKARLDGTLFCGTNTLHIMGQLNNGLLAGAGEIIIDGPVKGNVQVRTGNLIITERGSIDGNLDYGSNKEISANERNRITGSVNYEVKERIKPEGFITFAIIAGAFFFLTILVSGLLLLLLPGIKGLFTREREASDYGKTLLWGLIPVFIYPVAIVVTLPLFPLAISLALAAIPLAGFSILLGLPLAGQYLFKLFKWKKTCIYLQFLFAFGVFFLLALIPFIKILVFLALIATGAGLIIGRLFKTDFSTTGTILPE